MTTRASSVAVRSSLQVQMNASPVQTSEGAEQADQRDRGARAGRKRHHSEGDADQHDPPDGDADLAADDRVEAALLQHQVGDQREAEQPGGERGRVEAGGHLA